MHSRTEFTPSTHSSLIAQFASVVQVARHVVGPPGSPVHVVPPRHLVTPTMHTSPSIASGGFLTQTRAAPCPVTHSSVVAHCTSVVHVRRQARGAPVAEAQTVFERQKVAPTVQGAPSIAVGSCGCRQTDPTQFVPV